MQALNSFGAGDIPMTAERYKSVADNGRSMVHIPFAVGAIGVFHSVPDSFVGASRSVHLTGCVLAKIFSRVITQWNDVEILDLNPGMSTAPMPIKVVHRVKGSSSTAGFTEYMNQTCPGEWKLSTGATLTDWPVDTFEAAGSDGMADFISSEMGAIGYIDAGHGHGRGLPEVALKNLNGVYLTTVEADIGYAATEALGQVPSPIPGRADLDWSAVNLYDKAGPSTWPITMISYLYVDKDLRKLHPETASLLLAFIKMLLGTEGQARPPPPGRPMQAGLLGPCLRPPSPSPFPSPSLSHLSRHPLGIAFRHSGCHPVDSPVLTQPLAVPTRHTASCSPATCASSLVYAGACGGESLRRAAAVAQGL